MTRNAPCTTAFAIRAWSINRTVVRMNSPLVCCTKCKATLLSNVFNLPDFTPCPSCQTPLQIEVFPALFRRFTPGRAGETIIEESDASCFYHPQKKAVVPCEGCGRFLCALC